MKSRSLKSMDQSLCKTFVTSALSSGEIYPTEGKEMGTMLGLFSFFAEWSFSLSERVTDEAFLKPKNFTTTSLRSAESLIFSLISYTLHFTKQQILG